MITVILKVDVLYSSILALSNTSDKCSDTSFGLSISFLLLCILLGWLYMFIRIGVSYKDKNPAIKYKKLTEVFFFCVVCMCYPIHIIMNNSLPIDCGFGCSEVVENMRVSTPNCNATTVNINMPCCDQLTKSIVRFVVTFLNFTALSIASIVFTAAYLEKWVDESPLRENRTAPECGQGGYRSRREKLQLYKPLFWLGKIVT